MSLSIFVDSLYGFIFMDADDLDLFKLRYRCSTFAVTSLI